MPRPRCATLASRRPQPGRSPCALGRASPGCPVESRAPLGPYAVLGSAVLSGLGTGERPDEGHGPDAAARAGPGDRERPPQGRRRPLTGTAGARWGLQVGASCACASPQPLEMDSRLRASHWFARFPLGESPPAPTPTFQISQVRQLPLIRQHPTPGPEASFCTLARVNGLPKKLQIWR